MLYRSILVHTKKTHIMLRKLLSLHKKASRWEFRKIPKSKNPEGIFLGTFWPKKITFLIWFFYKTFCTLCKNLRHGRLKHCFCYWPPSSVLCNKNCCIFRYEIYEIKAHLNALIHVKNIERTNKPRFSVFKKCFQLFFLHWSI